MHSTGDLLARLARLPPAQAAVLRRRWDVWGRPDQQAPGGAWRTWLILAGRGWGKSRTGAEWVRAQATSGRASRIALVARTAADVRDVIVEGESGILAISPPHERPIWEPSRRRLTWPGGTIATTYSAEEPDQLRGPQHDAAWCVQLERAEVFAGARLGIVCGRAGRTDISVADGKGNQAEGGPARYRGV